MPSLLIRIFALSVLLQLCSCRESLSPRSWTPLHEACYAGQFASAKDLLQKGADVNARTRSGKTALMLAAETGNLELVQLLVHAGAEASLMDQGYETALSIAAYKGHIEIVALLFDTGDAAPEDVAGSFIAAAGQGRFPIVEFFLKKGVSPNHSNRFGITPLLVASYSNQPDMVLFLRKHGAR